MKASSTENSLNAKYINPVVSVSDGQNFFVDQVKSKSVNTVTSLINPWCVCV